MSPQSQSVQGTGAVGVQITGDRNSVVLRVGTAELGLDPRHRLRGAPRDERELLLTDLRATDLVGRAEDGASLRAWLDAPAPVSGRCLTGRAGVGKTRLAIELCEAAEAAGWRAGFASPEALQRFQAAQGLSQWHGGERALVVVDDAAASAPLLRAWLEGLCRRVSSAGDQPLRLLLLERHADPGLGWWADLARPGDLSGRGPDHLLDPPVSLPSLRAVGDRRALMWQAMRIAAALRGVAPPALPAPGADPAFEARLADEHVGNEPLHLVMAGMVAVGTGAPAALALNRAGLLERVAASESARLERLARGRGADPALVRHLAACLTLQRGCDRDAAERLIEEERRAMRHPDAVSPETLARLLADALPPVRSAGGAGPPGREAGPAGAVDRVRPDAVAGAFLIAEFGRDGRPPPRQAAIVERAWRRAGAPVVETVVRAAQDHARGDAAHPSLGWLGHLAGLADLPALLAIAAELPHETVAMRECAAGVQERIVALRRRDMAGTAASGDGWWRRVLGVFRRPPPDGSLAEALNDLAIRQAALGRSGQALAASEEAVAIQRARGPGAAPFLANALNSLSDIRLALGHLPEALAAATEAVAIRRGLASRHPDAFGPQLAASLNNLSVCLSALGRREEALAAIEESTAIRRDLAVRHDGALDGDLASSLINLSGCRANLGALEGALAAIEEAVALYRALASQRPDAFAPDLATALNNASNHLAGLGRGEAALAAIEEATAIRRDLASRRPDAFNPDLADTLTNLSARLWMLARRQEALAANEEAVALYRVLRHRSREAFEPRLAASLNNLSGCLSALGRNREALAAVEEAVALYRGLAEIRPEAHEPGLSASLNNLANRLSEMRRHEEALAAIEAAVAIRRALAARHPEAFRADLATSLNNLSNHLSHAGRHADALAAIEQAVAIRRPLASRLPEAGGPDLALSLYNLSIHLAAADRPGPALEASREAMETLADPFLRSPAAHEARMRAILDRYRRLCRETGREPDLPQLGPVQAGLDALRPNPEEPEP